jgi:hypothetical protein
LALTDYLDYPYLVVWQDFAWPFSILSELERMLAQMELLVALPVEVLELLLVVQLVMGLDLKQENLPVDLKVDLQEPLQVLVLVVWLVEKQGQIPVE